MRARMNIFATFGVSAFCRRARFYFFYFQSPYCPPPILKWDLCFAFHRHGETKAPSPSTRCEEATPRPIRCCFGAASGSCFFIVGPLSKQLRGRGHARPRRRPPTIDETRDGRRGEAAAAAPETWFALSVKVSVFLGEGGDGSSRGECGSGGSGSGSGGSDSGNCSGCQALSQTKVGAVLYNLRRLVLKPLTDKLC